MEQDSIGTLKEGEIHPAAHSAMDYVKSYLNLNPTGTSVFTIMEAFASSALSGNRLADICHETLHRILHGEPVSDRYLLGLAWTLKQMKEQENKPTKRKSK